MKTANYIKDERRPLHRLATVTVNLGETYHGKVWTEDDIHSVQGAMNRILL